MVVVEVGDAAGSAAGTGRPKELAAGRYTSFTDSALLLTLGAMLRAALRSLWCSGFRRPRVAREGWVTPRR